jgi:hypothetical protein
MLIILLIVSLLGWRPSLRRLRNTQGQVDQSARRETTEVLPKVAHRALTTMYSTLFQLLTTLHLSKKMLITLSPLSTMTQVLSIAMLYIKPWWELFRMTDQE